MSTAPHSQQALGHDIAHPRKEATTGHHARGGGQTWNQTGLAWNHSSVLDLTPQMKINSEWTKGLNVRVKTIKLLEKNIGANLLDLDQAMISLDMTPKVQATKKEKQLVVQRTSLRELSFSQFLEQIKNSFKLIIKRQQHLKMDKESEQACLLGRYTNGQ